MRLVSLPYLDGPALEWVAGDDAEAFARCLWFIPLTPREVTYKQTYGLEALERVFQGAGLDYLDPGRPDLAIVH